MDRGVWWASLWRSQRIGHDWATNALTFESKLPFFVSSAYLLSGKLDRIHEKVQCPWMTGSSLQGESNARSWKVSGNQWKHNEMPLIFICCFIYIYIYSLKETLSPQSKITLVESWMNKTHTTVAFPGNLQWVLQVLCKILLTLIHLKYFWHPTF